MQLILITMSEMTSMSHLNVHRLKKKKKNSSFSPGVNFFKNKMIFSKKYLFFFFLKNFLIVKFVVILS